jgi:hypothetical protein
MKLIKFASITDELVQSEKFAHIFGYIYFFRCRLIQ